MLLIQITLIGIFRIKKMIALISGSTVYKRSLVVDLKMF